MRKLAKSSMIALAVMLTVAVGIGNVWAGLCGDTTYSGSTDTTCYCGDTVVGAPGYTYVMTSDLRMSDAVPGPCTTKHGLMVGNAYLTIDGNGYKIDGGGAEARDCQVQTYAEGVPERQWCSLHPCRQDTTGDALDSGIVNANTSLGTSANPNAPLGQGGASNVTIKDTEITGWCDGIWISGDCDTNGDGTVGDERRLVGLLVEGNHIHDNGKGPCGTYTPNTNPSDPDDGGDWTYHYYTDAIFTAQIGLDAVNAPSTWGACGLGLPVNIAQSEWSDMFQWWETDPSVCGVELASLCGVENGINRIIHNIIYNQDGCAAISCSGGMGITLQGGLEIEPFDWAGGNDIAKNLIKNVAMSGISYSHATRDNRIRGNVITGCGYGGVTNGCGWCDRN
jgi:hypothetical protein